jgi:hypothetical protein
VNRSSLVPAPGSADRRLTARIRGLALEARFRMGSEMITRSVAAASIRSTTAAASGRKWYRLACITTTSALGSGCSSRDRSSARASTPRRRSAITNRSLRSSPT